MANIGTLLDLILQRDERLITALESRRPITDLAVKLTLTLKETSRLSGLSQRFLLDTIHSKRLKAANQGRGWNIKRDDLNTYVNTL